MKAGRFPNVLQYTIVQAFSRMPASSRQFGRVMLRFVVGLRGMEREWHTYRTWTNIYVIVIYVRMCFLNETINDNYWNVVLLPYKVKVKMCVCKHVEKSRSVIKLIIIIKLICFSKCFINHYLSWLEFMYTNKRKQEEIKSLKKLKKKLCIRINS